MNDQDAKTTGDCAQGSPKTQSERRTLDKDIYRAEAHLHQLNNFKELREAARPLIEYLRKAYNPMHQAIVTCSGVKITGDVVRVPLE